MKKEEEIVIDGAILTKAAISKIVYLQDEKSMDFVMACIDTIILFITRKVEVLGADDKEQSIQKMSQIDSLCMVKEILLTFASPLQDIPILD